MLNDTKRRIAAMAVGTLALFALAGCYTMKSENIYHADGTIDATILIAMDDSLVQEQVGDAADPAQAFVDQMTADPAMADLAKQLGDSLTIDPYSEDGQSGLLMTMVAVTPEQLAKANSAQNAPAGDSTITVADGNITLEYVADPELMANYDDSSGSLADMGMDLDSLSALIDLEARHTFPGPVISTTIGEIDPDNPNSVVITDLADINSVQGYTIVASDGSSGGLSLQWMLIMAILVLAGIGGAVAAVVTRSRKAPATAVTEGVSVAPLAAEFVPAPIAPTAPPALEDTAPPEQ